MPVSSAVCRISAEPDLTELTMHTFYTSRGPTQYSSSIINLCIFLSHILMLMSAHSFECDHMAVLCACVHYVQTTAWPVGIIVRSHESCKCLHALQIFESFSLFTTNVVFI